MTAVGLDHAVPITAVGRFVQRGSLEELRAVPVDAPGCSSLSRLRYTPNMEGTEPMHARAQVRYTEADYFALEEQSEERHEFIDGEIIAMAGGTGAHSLIAANISGELRARLKGHPCRAFSADRRVSIEATGDYVFPDALVVCPPHDLDALATSTPRVVAEVLSPTTRKHDLGTKLQLYFTVPSLTDVLLVEPESRQIEHYHRATPAEWVRRVVTTGTVPLESLGIELPLDEVYEHVLAPAG